ncbi:MAG TPA: PQQ-binding-like beta-propeller repeat protein [Terriglobia bacterium]|nr:PQQ-binding-like beta-propeller repeat protein [Terriglobia bacterium]
MLPPLRWSWIFLLAAVSTGADWDRFRGPNGSGIAEATGLPEVFGLTQNLIWRTALPPGHSSPILSRDRIFLTGVEKEKLYLIAMERRTGRIIWRRESPRVRTERLHKLNNPASATPASDGTQVYVFFGDYGLVCYDWQGKERWRTPLGPFSNVYGMGVSPIVVEDSVVLVVDQSRDSYIAAFKKTTGALQWKQLRPDAVSGSSVPVLYRETRGRTQIIAPSSRRMESYDARTGEVLWYVTGLPGEMKSQPILDGSRIFVNGYAWPDNEAGNIRPVPSFEEGLAAVDTNQDGFISKEEADSRAKTAWSFIDLDADGRMHREEWDKYRALMSSENALLAYRLDSSGDRPTASLLWKYNRAIPQLPSIVVYQDVLYMITDAGILTTLDPATGFVLKQGRLRGLPDSYLASIVAADGKIFIASQSGIVAVLKAGREQELLSANNLDEDIFATPAIDKDRIFLRTVAALYCFGANK